MEIVSEHQSIKLKQPFTISRDTSTECHVVKVRVSHEGKSAEGECTPYLRYGESVESVMKQIDEISQLLVELPSPYEARQHLQTAMLPGAARNAIDCALWALEAKLQDKKFPESVFDITMPMETAMTVSLATKSVMAQQAKDYVDQGATLLKVKLNHQDVVEKLAAIRHEAPNVKIIVDANEAWSELSLPSLLDELLLLDIKMIEQPLPAGQDIQLSTFQHVIPICADESCHTREQLANLQSCYDMINIKLDKTGGLTEALALKNRAEKLGLRIMVGCMLGTSIAMKAALPVAQGADVVDLDGPILLGVEEEDGLVYKNGSMSWSM